MTSFLIALFSGGGLVFLFRKYHRRIALTTVMMKTIAGNVPEPATDKSAVLQAAGTPTSSSFTTAAASKLDYSAINRAYRIADMHFSRGDFVEAEKWFIKVLALHEYHPEALNLLGVIYIQQNNLKKAALIYRKLLSSTQKESTYYCNFGRCLYNQGRLDEALEAYENAVKLDASKPARLVSIGQIYYEKKDFPKSLSYFMKAVELDPQNSDYLELTLELAELAGDHDRLQKSLKKLVELDPYNESAKEKLAALETNSVEGMPMPIQDAPTQTD